MALDLDAVKSALTGRLGREIEQFETVPSTMDLARLRASGGAAEGLVVIAEEQTAGRGRLGRQWVSPPGLNLYFTLILRPDLATVRRLPYLMPLGVAFGLDALGFAPAIKWPNDIQLGGRKVSGMLIETVAEGESVVAVLAGIGINVNLIPEQHPEIAAIATSLAAAAGRELSREAVLAAVLDGIASALDSAPATAFAGWRGRLSTLGRQVRLRSGPEVYEGTAVDVDDQGGLIVELTAGRRQAFAAGEVTTQV